MLCVQYSDIYASGPSLGGKKVSGSLIAFFGSDDQN